MFFNQVNRLLIGSTLLALIVPMFCSVMMRHLEKETEIDMTVKKILAISRSAEHPNEYHLERKVLIHLTIVQHLKMQTLITHLASHDAPEGSSIAQSLHFLTRRLEVQIVADPEMLHRLPFMGSFTSDNLMEGAQAPSMPTHESMMFAPQPSEQDSEAAHSHTPTHLEMCQRLRQLLDRLRFAHAQEEDERKEHEVQIPSNNKVNGAHLKEAHDTANEIVKTPSTIESGDVNITNKVDGCQEEDNNNNNNNNNVNDDDEPPQMPTIQMMILPRPGMV